MRVCAPPRDEGGGEGGRACVGGWVGGWGEGLRIMRPHHATHAPLETHAATPTRRLVITPQPAESGRIEDPVESGRIDMKLYVHVLYHSQDDYIQYNVNYKSTTTHLKVPNSAPCRFRREPNAPFPESGRARGYAPTRIQGRIPWTRPLGCERRLIR